MGLFCPRRLRNEGRRRRCISAHSRRGTCRRTSIDRMTRNVTSWISPATFQSLIFLKGCSWRIEVLVIRPARGIHRAPQHRCVKSLFVGQSSRQHCGHEECPFPNCRGSCCKGADWHETGYVVVMPPGCNIIAEPQPLAAAGSRYGTRRLAFAARTSAYRARARTHVAGAGRTLHPRARKPSTRNPLLTSKAHTLFCRRVRTSTCRMGGQSEKYLVVSGYSLMRHWARDRCYPYGFGESCNTCNESRLDSHPNMPCRSFFRVCRIYHGREATKIDSKAHSF